MEQELKEGGLEGKYRAVCSFHFPWTPVSLSGEDSSVSSTAPAPDGERCEMGLILQNKPVLPLHP